MGKIKQFIESDRGKDILTILILILVGLGSFELGRLSEDSQNSGIKAEYSTQNTNIVSSIAETPKIPLKTTKTQIAGKNFVASNRGSKYYPVGCEAGKALKQENRIYFATREAAEAAGYELSSSCR